jgi:hypothetical protein
VSRNIIVPSQSKAYIVNNQSNAAVVIKGSATTGVSINAGKSALVAWDGSDFVLISNDLSAPSPIGNVTPNTGAFTTLSSNSTTTLDGTTIPASATLTKTTDKLNVFAATTSAELAGVITDETGTGALVFGTSPTLVSPALGTPTSGVVTNLTGTASININGTVGATTPAAGAFTSVTASLPSVISVNSSDTALRITQVGTGNALLVEDSANPDSTPFVIDANGRVVVGATAAPLVNLGAAGQFSLVSVGGPISQTVSRFSADSGGPTQIFFKGRGLTSSDFAVVSNGDSLANLLFYGADGTQGISAASITAAVDGTPGTNDMPGRLVFSTTADGASSPTERMRIDSAGNVGLGGAAAGGRKVDITGTLPAASGFSIPYNLRGTIPSGATTAVYGFYSTPTTEATAFTLPALNHFFANPQAFGAGSTVTNQYGFHAGSTLTGATNNYGFYSNIASGTGRWNFYAAGSADNFFQGNVGIGTTTASKRLEVRTSVNALEILSTVRNDQAGSGVAAIGFNVSSTAAAETTSTKAGIGLVRQNTSGVGSLCFYTNNSTSAGDFTTADERMRIDSAGRVGIGTTTLTGFLLRGTGNLTGSTSSRAVDWAPAIQSDVTTTAYTFSSVPSVQDSAFTLANLGHFRAAQGVKGASATVTNQYGFSAESSLTGATNNYGFYSNIASGTGRWNFYAAGSAANYFAGDMQLDKTVTAGGTTGAQTINKNAGTVNFAAAATSLVVTDSRVTTSSIIICTVGTNDTTLKSVAAVAGAGSFTLHASAAATAETRVNFLIIN